MSPSRRFQLLVFLITLIAPIHTMFAAQPGLLTDEFIFDAAPFPQCHASTIVESKNGLVAAWFGGTEEKNPDVFIWSRILETPNGLRPFRWPTACKARRSSTLAGTPFFFSRRAGL